MSEDHIRGVERTAEVTGKLKLSYGTVASCKQAETVTCYGCKLVLIVLLALLVLFVCCVLCCVFFVFVRNVCEC